MAFADYHPCDLCGKEKTFYDSDMDYTFTPDGQLLYGGHRVVCICAKCAEHNEIKIVPKEYDHG